MVMIAIIITIMLMFSGVVYYILAKMTYKSPRQSSLFKRSRRRRF